MLSILGIILIFSQFCIDAWAITRHQVELKTALDFLGFYAFGLVGIFLFLLARFVLKRKINKLEDELYDEWEEDDE